MEQHLMELEMKLEEKVLLLFAAEREKEGAIYQLEKMEEVADEANAKFAVANTKLNSATEALSKSNQELKIKEKTIESLKVEHQKLEALEAKLSEKDESLENLKAELSYAESSKKCALATLRRKVEELQKHEEEKISLQEELWTLKFELELVRHNQATAEEGSSLKYQRVVEEMKLLKHELMLAIAAEADSKKAKDGLALALKEVATEAGQAKEKLFVAQEVLRQYKMKAEELKNLSIIQDKHRTVLNEAREDADRYRNTSERLRLEAEESLLAWNRKEESLVDCIKRAEDEKSSVLEENSKLLDLLRTANNTNKMTMRENQKLRELLIQNLNKANAAKQAERTATVEYSQLRNALAET